MSKQNQGKVGRTAEEIEAELDSITEAADAEFEQEKAAAAPPMVPTPEAGAPPAEVQRAKCVCGCGGSPKGRRAVFVQGHDARLVGFFQRTIAGRAWDDERRRALAAVNHPAVVQSAKLGPLALRAKAAVANQK